MANPAATVRVPKRRGRTQRCSITQPLTSAGGHPRIALAGTRGFIASSVLWWAEAHDQSLSAVPRFRVTELRHDDVITCARRWPDEHRETYDGLCKALQGFDVVINAAGLAAPESPRSEELLAGNAVHAAVLAMAAKDAGARRFVHVSSAVVQGRLDPLDESPRHFPVSPYGVSKAEGERLLLDGEAPAPAEVVVYRPTSVQSASRHTTRRLARLAALPFFPVVGAGDQPIPVALVENVAAGILFAATMPAPPTIALQPWEGVTSRLLIEFLAAPRIVSLPRGSARVAHRVVQRVTAPSARLTSLARRLELVLRGQAVDARNLEAAGFKPPVGHDGWVELGRTLAGDPARSSRRVAPSRIGEQAG